MFYDFPMFIIFDYFLSITFCKKYKAILTVVAFIR